jgi:hypothetical protein
MNSSQAVVSTKLTAAQAEEKFGKKPGMVWDEDLQEFIALGQALMVEQMGRPVDLAKNLEQFKANRAVVLKFIRSEYFEEAKYDSKGDLVPGQLGDFYKVPGSDQKALTKRGSSKIKQLFRWSRGAARRVAGEESKEYCSSTIEVPIVDHLGRVVGAGIGSCNTAEKAFTSQNAIKKYGGWCEWKTENGKKQLVIERAPDYRAALHDVTSKATKRGDTQATIVAAALEELFTVARDDEGDHKDEQDEQTPVYPGAAPRFRFPKQIKTKQFAHLAGKLIDDESISVDDLTKLVQWCRTTTTNDPAALDRLRVAAENELERRRNEEDDTSASVL